MKLGVREQCIYLIANDFTSVFSFIEELLVPKRVDQQIILDIWAISLTFYTSSFDVTH